MRTYYEIGLDGGLDELAEGIKQYKKWIEQKTKELLKRLADLGKQEADNAFSEAIYAGENGGCRVTVEMIDDGYVVRAEGEAVLFIEFGTGVKYYGSGHPEGEELNLVPGSWSMGEYGKGHWDDPNGWWIPKIRIHDYGNPPNKAMYETVRLLERDFRKIVQEVFGND